MEFKNVEITSKTFRARLTVGGDYNNGGRRYVVEMIRKIDRQPHIPVEASGSVELTFRCKTSGQRYRIVNNQKPAAITVATELSTDRITQAPRSLEGFAYYSSVPTFSNPVPHTKKGGRDGR
jgi:hypothetical protein